jgi:hypothetical protein
MAQYTRNSELAGVVLVVADDTPVQDQGADNLLHHPALGLGHETPSSKPYPIQSRSIELRIAL